jgi:hypothetical protein
LRPAIAPTVVRSDSTYAPAKLNDTFVSTLLAGYRFVPNVGLYAKLAYVHNNPEKGPSGNTLSNPLIFGLFTPELLKGLRLPISLGVALPLGGGGGNDFDKVHKAAQAQAVFARSGLENALYAVNFTTLTEGIGLAWIRDRLTLQAEATFFQSFRSRGDKVEKDKFRANSTYGFHAGYAVLDMLTLSAEIRYQRWLSDAQPVTVAAVNRDTLTIGGGARFNLPLGKITLRPGFAVFTPLDDPMRKAGMNRLFTFDLPILF